MNVRRLIASYVFVGCALFGGGVALANHGPRVVDPVIEGSAIALGKNVVQNVMNTRELSTFAVCIRSAKMIHELEEPGYFTVFAPLNDAFDGLKSESLIEMLQPDNIDVLRKVVRYHVVRGKFSTVTLRRMMHERQGLVRLKTIEGGILMVTEREAGELVVTDGRFRTAFVTTADVYQSNGVVHVIDKVMLP